MTSLHAEIFDDAIPHEFIIEISQEEWEGITQDMLDYAKKHPIEPFYPGDGREYRTDVYRKADFIYRHGDGTEVKLTQVGIRSRGNESRRLPYQNGNYYKSHFKVKFDETFDMPADAPDTAAVSQRRFAGLKALNFKWSRYNPWDTYANKSKINELFSLWLLGKVGVNAPRMSMGILKFRIAGKEVNYGLYGIVEPVDKPFLRRRYGASEGDLYKCLYLERGSDLTEKSLEGDAVGVKDADANYRPRYDLQTWTSTLTTWSSFLGRETSGRRPGVLVVHIIGAGGRLDLERSGRNLLEMPCFGSAPSYEESARSWSASRRRRPDVRRQGSSRPLYPQPFQGDNMPGSL